MSLNNNCPFKDGPPFRRVYDKKDIIVQAMLQSGLEEFITNGFHMEEVNKKEENPETQVQKDDSKPVSMPILKKDNKTPKQTPVVNHTTKSKVFQANQEAKYRPVLAELYQMEEELKKSNMIQKQNKD